MMGRRILKYGLMASLFLMFMGMLLPVSAHAVTGGHVQLTITADKEQYEQGDTATIRIGIQNCSEKSVEDVAYTVTFPDEMKCVEGSQDLLFVPCGTGETNVIDPSLNCSIIKIDKSVDAVLPVGNNNIFVLDQTGTFSIDIKSPRKSYSYFDGNNIELLSVQQKAIQSQVILPNEYNKSLHGHAYPITAAAYSENVFISGDLLGFVNVWSPTLSKI